MARRSGCIGAPGTRLTASAGGLPVWQTPSSLGMLSWGNQDVGSTVTTRYLSPGFDEISASTTPIQIRVPFAAGTLKNMQVDHNGPNGNGNPIVYTLRVNGVPSALTVSLSSLVADGSDNVHSVAVVQGDHLDIEVTKAAGVGTSPDHVTVTLEIGP